MYDSAIDGNSLTDDSATGGAADHSYSPTPTDTPKDVPTEPREFGVT